MPDHQHRAAPRRIFALKAWTISVDAKGRYFISPTAHFDKSHDWRGPYPTPQDATDAIASKLLEEFVERDERLTAAAVTHGRTQA